MASLLSLSSARILPARGLAWTLATTIGQWNQATTTAKVAGSGYHSRVVAFSKTAGNPQGHIKDRHSHNILAFAPINYRYCSHHIQSSLRVWRFAGVRSLASNTGSGGRSSRRDNTDGTGSDDWFESSSTTESVNRAPINNGNGSHPAHMRERVQRENNEGRRGTEKWQDDERHRRRPRQQPQRPNGYAYTYAPEAGRIVSVLSENEILKLLEKRALAKRDRQYDKADGILEELAAKGVFVYDKRRVWRADGFMFDFDRRTSEKPPMDLGINGHNLTLSSEAGPSTSVLSEKEIHALLAERLHSRLRRNFVHADRIREELQDEGVFVNDTTNEWRADGVPFVATAAASGNSTGNTEQDAKSVRYKFGPLGHDYKLSPNAGPNISQLSDAEIHVLLRDRLLAKISRDFMEADCIRDDLYSAGVFVDDNLREWRADGIRFEFSDAVGGYPDDKYGDWT